MTMAIAITITITIINGSIGIILCNILPDWIELKQENIVKKSRLVLFISSLDLILMVSN